MDPVNSILYKIVSEIFVGIKWSIIIFSFFGAVYLFLRKVFPNLLSESEIKE